MMTVRELMTKLEMLDGAALVFISGEGELHEVVQVSGEAVCLLDDNTSADGEVV